MYCIDVIGVQTICILFCMKTCYAVTFTTRQQYMCIRIVVIDVLYRYYWIVDNFFNFYMECIWGRIDGNAFIFNNHGRTIFDEGNQVQSSFITLTSLTTYHFLSTHHIAYNKSNLQEDTVISLNMVINHWLSWFYSVVNLTHSRFYFQTWIYDYETWVLLTLL